MASKDRIAEIAEMESRIDWDAAAVEDEAERQQVAARLPVGTHVVDDEEDPEPRIGVIVEATAEELARGEDECCTFDPGRTYVLVEWSYPEYPEDGVEREWESPRYLAVTE